MSRPGERIQIDVKFVPAACLAGDAKGQKFYQYTAIDEYSRWRYIEAFEEHSTYSSAVFAEHLIKVFPYPIECVQTDNGQEFTNRSTPKKMVFAISLSNHIHHAITEKWKEVIERITRTFMQPIPFILSRISRSR